MCGLVGMIGPGISSMDIKAIRDLAYVTGLRGTHSTGVYQGKTDGSNMSNEILTKDTMPVSDFLYFHDLDPKYNEDQGINNKVLNDISCNLMLLHCRHATLGSIIPENAHPFRTEKYIGIHNGSLTDWRYTSKNVNSDKTDSERMFMDMDHRGIEAVLADLDTASAYAVMIWDIEKQKLFVARNNKRTLYYTNNKRRMVSYFSSEIEMLKLALNRRDIEYGDIWYFEPGKLYEFNPLSGGFSFEKDTGYSAVLKGTKLPESKKVTPSRGTVWRSSDYGPSGHRRPSGTVFGDGRSRSNVIELHKKTLEEGTEGSSETTPKTKSSPVGTRITRIKDTSSLRNSDSTIKRSSKFYCDECSGWTFGHDKEACDRMFGDDTTLLCGECLEDLQNRLMRTTIN